MEKNGGGREGVEEKTRPAPRRNPGEAGKRRLRSSGAQRTGRFRRRAESHRLRCHRARRGAQTRTRDPGCRGGSARLGASAGSLQTVGARNQGFTETNNYSGKGTGCPRGIAPASRGGARLRPDGVAGFAKRRGRNAGNEGTRKKKES